ncbi:hypothetical protein EJ02DRAFT_360916 [Clathrospora elynae]|uniref:DUF6314 domain-containing protein n=1 Tax=Clathrospora elynae TaxID=706981 RepID=A0A6A5S505_9PLEO|nr:hypothetical protein EJ02DRAFT_360916 [Clathrospora elynae]
MATPAQAKSVLIVGAGPSGLIAANTLKKYGYIVSVWEAGDHVGGMWAAEQGESGDKCSPDMKTNLSRFTVAFSDLSWSSVDLSDSVSGFTPADPPIFPKAWQVGHYLKAYAEKFGIDRNISTHRRVVNARPEEDGTWKVYSSDNGSSLIDVSTFDRLIVASGFFDKPAKSFSLSPQKDLANIQHSSRFRELSALAGSAGKVVVIGGGISGSEAAAQAAFQISNARNSPSKTKPTHAKSKVYHIINRPFYCLPRHLPQDPQSPEGDYNLAPKFLPLDLILYNLSRRGDGEISAVISTVPPEKAKKGHEFLRSVLGGDQSDIGSPELVYKDSQTQYPAYTGITDTYTEFVRSGIIVPVQGWVEEVKQQANKNLLDISLKQKEPWYDAADKETTGTSTIHDVVAIIEATGYQNDLDYLDPTVRDEDHLDEDTTCPRIPFLLTRGSVLATGIPTIGFVGFYEGPYWGVMEMQARFLAETWAKHEPTEPGYLPEHEIYQHDVTKRMRQAMINKSLQVPQFWMTDYVGLMEEFARNAGVRRDDSAFGGKSGPAFPSRYHGNGTYIEAEHVVQEVANVIKGSNEEARFVAAAVFRGMQGIWNIHRIIKSRTNTPGGTFSGTAHFHPRAPTDPTIYAAEYLYIEEGTFTLDTGVFFQAKRRYVYRYNETVDNISAWFVKEDDESTDALFNTWAFYEPDDKEHGWMAQGSHWCDPDTYNNTCEFRFRGASIEKFGITYEVEGPNKDYSHESWYERPKAEYRAGV